MEEQGLRCEVEKSVDADGGRLTTVTCHGRLVAGTAEVVKETVKPLIGNGGKIVVDVGDVQFVDSMGLGALVGLKVSAIGAGYCRLEFRNLSQRLQELLRITSLAELFRS